MKNSQRLTYYFSTIRHLTVAQIWHRGHRVIQRRWWRLLGREAPQPAHCDLASCVPLYLGLSEVTNKGPWTEDLSLAIERARAISENRFSFLNQCVAFTAEPDWHDPNLSHLWRFNLNYFDYVLELLIWWAAGEKLVHIQPFGRSPNHGSKLIKRFGATAGIRTRFHCD